MAKKIWLGILLAIVAGLLWAWLAGPQWLAEWNQASQVEQQAFQQRGASLGGNTDQQGCFEAALQSFDQCQDSEYKCTVNNGILLKACWQKSLPSEGFCDAVPAFAEKPSEDDKAWMKDSCFAAGVNAAGCRLLMRQKQQLCSS
ncbi:hypothetical protein [Aliamphritea ceti]|uniref:hypothetical protein n=1 Tax=Aliamphritea ceti TaxID=1524258 RepID=UPI0021C405B3|nr:hypothetical protein [Aliamphritea ceti]